MRNFINKIIGLNSNHTLVAPVTGSCIDITKVPDAIFADKMLGEGIAFQFSGDTVYAPCDSTVVMVAPTFHAIGMKNKDGLEILLHIGLNTVDLGGKGLQALVKMDQKIRAGTPLIKIDRQFMDSNEIDLTSPMVITNSGEFSLEMMNIDQEVIQKKSEVIRYLKK